MVFLFSLILNLYFLIPPVIEKIVNPISELVTPILSKEAKPEIETHLVIVEDKVITCSIDFKIVESLLCLLPINSF